jgi:hypothetical protein
MSMPVSITATMTLRPVPVSPRGLFRGHTRNVGQPLQVAERDHAGALAALVGSYAQSSALQLGDATDVLHTHSNIARG